LFKEAEDNMRITEKIKSKTNLVLCTKILMIVGLILWYYWALPNPLFDDPTATVIETRKGVLLGARIAKDGQWRFPETDSVPIKFSKCILAYEDQQFYSHFGFNPITIGNALIDNFKAGKVVRGGSTITQQVIRLARKGKKRTYFEKIKELILATRLEFRYSKEKILKLYASHAPFGGNVVGMDMAAWRYFGLPAHKLSWAESATLAVLPNSPSLIHLGKNREELEKKRNILLNVLLKQKSIDTLTYHLAVSEKIPQKPYGLPQTAPHLLDQIAKTYGGKRKQTTIDIALQKQANKIVDHHFKIQKQNGIYNMAVLVMDIETREVKTYIGNTSTDVVHQKDVDIIQAPRSTGSVLKPLLYTAMIDKGELLPEQLVSDIPTTIAGYSPKNYDESFSGVVPANKALARSLNIPAVRLLQEYGLQRFRDELRAFRIKHLKYSADHYGLSLIVGGAEASLWDLCKTYAGLAGTITHFENNSSEYFENEFAEPVIFANDQVNFGKKAARKTIFGAGSIWLTFEAMKGLNRPEGDEAWEFYDSSIELAWKTGTSFGNRDAWAIGVNQKYVVGVWVGNADGEGRPEHTGLHSAAPVLFDIFNLLQRSKWFLTPFDDLIEMKVCNRSGYVAGKYCIAKKQWTSSSEAKNGTCPYHQLIHLDQSKQYRVNSSCQEVSQIHSEPWFVLPPLQAYYYKTNDASYRQKPPFRKDCLKEKESNIDFIFPKRNSSVYLPKGFDGKTNDVVLKIAHTDPEVEVFWYLDNTYLGKTHQFHEMPIKPQPGSYSITVVDDKGHELKRKITIKK